MEEGTSMDGFKKLSLLVSALAVSGVLAGEASAMTRSDLQVIRDFVDARDDNGLRAFLLANPGVLNGSPLAAELQAFLGAPPRRNIFTALGLANPIPAGIRDRIEAAKSDDSIY